MPTARGARPHPREGGSPGILPGGSYWTAHAMTAAIFGLIGVIAGGLVNGALSVRQERRRERRAARPAARAVMDELSEMQAILSADARREPEYQAGAVPAPRAWPDHRMTLASVVDGETWSAISGAYQGGTPQDDATQVLLGWRTDFPNRLVP